MFDVLDSDSSEGNDMSEVNTHAKNDEKMLDDLLLAFVQCMVRQGATHAHQPQLQHVAASPVIMH